MIIYIQICIHEYYAKCKCLVDINRWSNYTWHNHQNISTTSIYREYSTMRLHTHLSSWHRLFKHLNHNQPLLFTPNFWSSIAQGRHFLTIAFCSSRRHHIFQWEELLIDLSSPTPPVSCWRQIGCMLLKNGTQTQTKRLCKAVIDVNVCIFYVFYVFIYVCVYIRVHPQMAHLTAKTD